ncbi:MAG: putative damage-inducible protein DinB [Planctomycetota bacterium]|jgi:uncharacterized damage-inducible protein DinB
MYSSEVLLDIHDRCHRGLTKLISHCGGFSHEQFRQVFDGFGYSSIQSQLCHVIGAEVYWFGVLEGRMDVDDRAEENLGAKEIGEFREQVFNKSATYLSKSAAEHLNAAGEFITWGGKLMTLVPAQVVLRTQTHIFQHQGQVAAMCRQLGNPINGIDYSHEP